MLFSLEKNFIKEQNQLINSLQDEVIARNYEINGLRNEIEGLRKEEFREKARMERIFEDQKKSFEEQAEKMKRLTVKIREQELELSQTNKSFEQKTQKTLLEEKKKKEAKVFDQKEGLKRGLDEKKIIHDYGKLFLIEL